MQLLYFAWVREKIGKDGETVSPPASVSTINELLVWLSGLSDGHADALADTSRLRIAVDQKFVGLGDRVEGAGEVAIFPPVTGG